MYLNANYLLQQHVKLFESSFDFNNFIQFCIENHEVFGSLTQKCLQLDKDKSTVSTFEVILINKNAVYYHSKEQLCEKFQLWSAKVRICKSVS